MSEVEPQVWIVILHWRGIEHTRACLESLKSLSYTNYNVLLVDNGSQNHDGQELVKEFPQTNLLELESNRGFSGGCNAGIDYCLEKDSQYIWLLNNDAKVRPETLSTLITEITAGTNIGAASAAIVNGDNFDHKLGMGKIDFLNAKAHLKTTDSAGSVCCDWISGSNMLLSATALKEIGSLNDDYFLYFEDVEICRRLKEAGFGCLFVPSTSIEHVDGASTEGDFSHWRYYYHSRNRLIFFSSYSNLLLRSYCLLRILMHHLRHIVVLPFRGEKGKRKLEVEQKALADFFAGVKGKVELDSGG